MFTPLQKKMGLHHKSLISHVQDFSHKRLFLLWVVFLFPYLNTHQCTGLNLPIWQHVLAYVFKEQNTHPIMLKWFVVKSHKAQVSVFLIVFLKAITLVFSCYSKALPGMPVPFIWGSLNKQLFLRIGITGNRARKVSTVRPRTIWMQ